MNRAKIKVLLCLSLALTLTGCGLTRSKATKLIDAAMPSMSETGSIFVPDIYKGAVKTDLQNAAEAADLGTHKVKKGPGEIRLKLYRLEKNGDAEVKEGGVSLKILVKKVEGVTGIFEEDKRATASFDWMWKFNEIGDELASHGFRYVDPPDFDRTKRHHGTAHFERYDDGWRVAAIETDE